jgi:hypothetical protein
MSDALGGISPRGQTGRSCSAAPFAHPTRTPVPAKASTSRAEAALDLDHVTHHPLAKSADDLGGDADLAMSGPPTRSVRTRKQTHVNKEP